MTQTNAWMKYKTCEGAKGDEVERQVREGHWRSSSPTKEFRLNSMYHGELKDETGEHNIQSRGFYYSTLLKSSFLMYY